MKRLRILRDGPPALPSNAVWAAYRRRKIEAQLEALTPLVLEHERRIDDLEARHR